MSSVSNAPPLVTAYTAKSNHQQLQAPPNQPGYPNHTSTDPSHPINKIVTRTSLRRQLQLGNHPIGITSAASSAASRDGRRRKPGGSKRQRMEMLVSNNDVKKKLRSAQHQQSSDFGSGIVSATATIGSSSSFSSTVTTHSNSQHSNNGPPSTMHQPQQTTLLLFQPRTAQQSSTMGLTASIKQRSAAPAAIGGAGRPTGASSASLISRNGTSLLHAGLAGAKRGATQDGHLQTLVTASMSSSTIASNNVQRAPATISNDKKSKGTVEGGTSLVSDPESAYNNGNNTKVMVGCLKHLSSSSGAKCQQQTSSISILSTQDDLSTTVESCCDCKDCDGDLTSNNSSGDLNRIDGSIDELYNGAPLADPHGVSIHRNLLEACPPTEAEGQTFEPKATSNVLRTDTGPLPTLLQQGRLEREVTLKGETGAAASTTTTIATTTAAIRAAAAVAASALTIVTDAATRRLQIQPCPPPLECTSSGETAMVDVGDSTCSGGPAGDEPMGTGGLKFAVASGDCSTATTSDTASSAKAKTSTDSPSLMVLSTSARINPFIALAPDQAILKSVRSQSSLLRDAATYGQDWIVRHKRREAAFTPWQISLGVPHSKVERSRLSVVSAYWKSIKSHNVSPSTVHVAVNNFSRLLNHMSEEEKEATPLSSNWALTACVAFRLALKYEERPDVLWEISDFWSLLPMFDSWSLDKSDQHINKVELVALRTLKDSMDVPLSPLFLSRYLAAGGWPEEVAKEYHGLGLFLVALSTFATGTGHALENVGPSKLAAAALVLSVKIINADRDSPAGLLGHMKSCKASQTSSTCRVAGRRTSSSFETGNIAHQCSCRYEFFPERLKSFAGYGMEELQPVIRGLSSLLRRKPSESDVLKNYFPVWGDNDWQ